jgi:threonine synthase
MTVRYRSTRAKAPATDPGVTFEEALFSGLAPDGGLYLPLTIPELPGGWQEAESFVQLATRVLNGWLPELGGELVEELAGAAFDFPVPLRRISGDRFILELFHGPTLAFKDFGARFMARVMNELLGRHGRRLTVLVATSGDTGSAVAAGFSGLDNLDVVLLYPEGRVSEVQERQLILQRPGVRSLAVRGTFDDCQRLVKEALLDEELAGLGLTSANSINIARLLPQQLYYLWALTLLAREHGVTRPLVSVPSGNLGNLTAGVLASLAGAPARHFIAAHNANDFFPRFLAGRSAAFEFGETIATLSNAMDVGAPSNFERLHALRAGGVPLLESGLISGRRVTDLATKQRIALTWQQDSYLVCPHTAVALEAVELRRREERAAEPALVLATAHPAKFPDVIESALPGMTPSSAELAALEGLPVSVQQLEPALEALRSVLRAG